MQPMLLGSNEGITVIASDFALNFFGSSLDLVYQLLGGEFYLELAFRLLVGRWELAPVFAGLRRLLL